MTDLQSAMAEVSAGVAEAMAARLQPPDSPEAPVWQAMRYACLGSGKRLRPFLTICTADLFGISRERSMQAAVAVEFVHCYSLIHDDLPAMDNSDLRRGRPALHRAFSEATAILAGDALLTLAFTVLSEPATDPDPAIRSALVAELAGAAGAHGMIGGQMMDMVADGGTQFVLSDVERLQSMKTGALITAACAAGAIIGRATDAQRAALAGYARGVGIAFQIADDLLDTVGDQATVGKDLGRDADAGKATFVSHLGIDGARRAANDYVDRAVTALSGFGDDADRLRQVARFAVERDS